VQAIDHECESGRRRRRLRRRLRFLG
jgi:hypothetical protein